MPTPITPGDALDYLGTAYYGFILIIFIYIVARTIL